MSLVTTITNIVAPSLPDNAVRYGGRPNIDRLPPVREYDEFSFDITFTDETLPTIPGNPVISIPVPIQSFILDQDISSVFITRLGTNSFRVNGIAINSFDDKYYRFTKEDGTSVILDPEKEDFWGVNYYKPDFRRFIELSYTASTVSGLESIVRYQTVNNDWEFSRLYLLQLVARGH